MAALTPHEAMAAWADSRAAAVAAVDDRKAAQLRLRANPQSLAEQTAYDIAWDEELDARRWPAGAREAAHAAYLGAGQAAGAAMLVQLWRAGGMGPLEIEAVIEAVLAAPAETS